jgi:hypothetical protein
MTMNNVQRIRLLNIGNELSALAQEIENPVDNEAITELGRLVDGLATDFGGRFPGCLVVLATIRRSDDTG